MDWSFLNTIGQRLSDYFKPYRTSFDYPENRLPEDKKVIKLPPDLGIKPAQAVAPAVPSPAPATQSAQFTMPDENTLREGLIRTRGADNPLVQNLALYLQAASQMPPGSDPMLPIILALRETQGGKDLLDPAKMKGPNDGLGDNNVYNLRNDTGAFQNYPDLQTAIMGNLDSGGISAGLVGLLNGQKDTNRYIYEDFRNDPTNLAKLFERWSPPADNNGSIEEQVQNYMWIRNNILGIPQ